MARTPPVTALTAGTVPAAGTAAGRELPAAGTAAGRELQIMRVAYGAALVLMPGTTIFLATGRVPGRRTRRVAQVLGFRHLAQAALTATAPRPGVFTIGWQVDAVHAASMLLLAAVSRAGRSAALTDALTEVAFAAAGFSASISEAVVRPPSQ
jgi:hypothetical protein